jgi:glyoxylase-like metal-dependent hydrolase (beta-lactamase superfamily II)
MFGLVPNGMAMTQVSHFSAQVPGAAERVSPFVRRIIAPNPGPYTYTGTCSYVIGRNDVAIVDPGPSDPTHIDALLDAVAGEALRYLLVTHTHCDHSPAARRLREKTGAPIFGCAPYAPLSKAVAGGLNLDAAHDAAYAPDRILKDGDILQLGELSVEVVATPGHSANHLCFALREERALFTGDHVMGWATTVVAPPDGSMRDYVNSLERLRERGDLVYWPGHGEPVRDPQRYLRALIHHRRQRELAILERLEKGDQTIATIVERIYEGIDRRLHGAAALSVFAHLEELMERGEVGSEGPPTLGARYFRV